jgi:hypothetical protein
VYHNVLGERAEQAECADRLIADMNAVGVVGQRYAAT